MKKKDYLSIFLICLFIILIYIIISLKGNVYGSTVDWESQHYFLPDYFRKLFYETHNLLPDFALNLGAGQNIYYFAYYGLLSPVILVSYLLPFINMRSYIIISSILLSMLSVYLMYKFLKNNGYSTKTCIISTVAFITAAPILFHTHRHIMFVNYMPFLILALMSVDYYFETGRMSSLAVSIFLIIMTSYFFSFSSLFIVLFYGIYKYTKQYKVNIKSFFKEGFKFLLPIFIGVLLSAVLILPVLYTLMNGRTISQMVPLTKLLKPTLKFSYLLYGTYTMGLTSIGLISIFNSLKKNSKYRFLAIISLLFLTFPIFNYILNGTLYINAKALIPLIPIIILLIAETIENKELNLKYILLGLVIMTVYSVLFEKINGYFFYLDFYISLIILYFGKKKDFINYIFIPLLLIMSISYNLTDTFVKKDMVDTKEDESIEYLINEITNRDDSFYRIGVRFKTLRNINNIYNLNYYNTTLYSSTFNKNYNYFYYDIMNNNIEYRNRSITSITNHKLFNDYMGIKYLITDYTLDDGYNLILQKNGFYLYESDNYYPLGFTLYDKTNINEFNLYTYPYNLYSILNSYISDEETTLENKINKIDLNYSIDEINFNYEVKDNVFKFDINDKGNVKIKTDVSPDEILFIRFKMLYSVPCNEPDTFIKINGNTNKLTCSTWKYHNQNYEFDYMIYDNADYLDIEIGQGRYEITDFEFYTLNKDQINVNYDKLNVNKSKTKGDKIEGTINNREDGYFIISIPYDLGFKIKVDNKLTDYENANEGLIGFNLEKGNHNITITYEAPYKKVGIICGIIGLLGLILLKVRDVKLWKKSQ